MALGRGCAAVRSRYRPTEGTMGGRLQVAFSRGQR
jgi:uncharacterized protein YceK